MLIESHVNNYATFDGLVNRAYGIFWCGSKSHIEMKD